MDAPGAREPRDAAAIVSGIRAGDPSAETAFYEKYRGGVVLMLRRRIDPSLAEDVAHDALTETLRILRTRTLDEPEKLAAFIHAIACNLLRNLARKRARQRTEVNTEVVEAVPDDARDPAAIASRTSLAAAVRRLLATLPVQRDRELLVRYYLDEHSKDDVCRDLDLSAEHFDRVIHRARQRLRLLVEQNADEFHVGDP